MKHLKTFEQNKIKNKKYSIVPVFSGINGIIEKVEDLNAIFKIKLLYIYNNGGLIYQRDSKPYSKSRYIIENNTLFTSDNLQQCKDVIKTIDDTNNYNL